MKKLALVCGVVLLALALTAQTSRRGPATQLRFGASNPASCVNNAGMVFINNTTGQIETCVGGVFVPQTIAGTTTNDNAAAGNIGEYISSTIATGSSVSLSTGTTANVTSISLTAGDWDVTGSVSFTFGATTSYTNLVGGISTTSATIGAQGQAFDFETAAVVPTAGADMTWSVPASRISIASTTTVFLVAQGTFTVSTLKAYGIIRARRVR